MSKPHAYKRNTVGFHFLICECGKHEAHAIHHAKRSMRTEPAIVSCKEADHGANDAHQDARGARTSRRR